MDNRSWLPSPASLPRDSVALASPTPSSRRGIGFTAPRLHGDSLTGICHMALISCLMKCQCVNTDSTIELMLGTVAQRMQPVMFKHTSSLWHPVCRTT
ncbi:hypothetical protein DAI22_12g071500 [Oryza sativa Japonica Group]|nr:hypothetical protein DAI22_12g071500 [Oryza sativa Japonica Group]